MVASSARRFHVALLALLAVLMSPVLSYAKCDPTTDPDKSDIANARAAVAAYCDCAGATSHGAYVSCAAQQANTVLVNKSCARFVKKCASKSTCGRSPSVTCCRTDATGVTKCAIKSGATACVPPKGGAACVGQLASCCDACGPGGCTTATTTTTIPMACGRGTSGVCGGSCPSLFDECVQDPQTGNCGCVLGPCRAIGGFGSCGGACPSLATCTLCASCGGCGCIIPCNGGDGPPTCNGTCPTGYTCGYSPSDHFCGCHQ